VATAQGGGGTADSLVSNAKSSIHSSPAGLVVLPATLNELKTGAPIRLLKLRLCHAPAKASPSGGTLRAGTMVDC